MLAVDSTIAPRIDAPLVAVVARVCVLADAGIALGLVKLAAKELVIIR